MVKERQEKGQLYVMTVVGNCNFPSLCFIQKVYIFLRSGVDSGGMKTTLKLYFSF